MKERKRERERQKKMRIPHAWFPICGPPWGRCPERKNEKNKKKMNIRKMQQVLNALNY